MSEEESKQSGAVRRTGETWEVPEHLEAMFEQACKGVRPSNQKVNWLTCSLTTRPFSVKTTTTSEGPSWYITVYQPQKEPDPSGNHLTELDHIRSRRQNARCNTFWREAWSNRQTGLRDHL